MDYKPPTPEQIAQRANALRHEAELQAAARQRLQEEAQRQHYIYKKENPWWVRHPLWALAIVLIAIAFLYDVFIGEPEHASMTDMCLEAAEAGWTDTEGCFLLD